MEGITMESDRLTEEQEKEYQQWLTNNIETDRR